MSFFKKLKNKLFKSSQKLEEGLDAIVGDGGVEEEVEEIVEGAPAAEEAARQPAQDQEAAPDRERALQEARAREQQARDEEIRAQEIEREKREREAQERQARDQRERMAAAERAQQNAREKSEQADRAAQQALQAERARQDQEKAARDLVEKEQAARAKAEEDAAARARVTREKAQAEQAERERAEAERAEAAQARAAADAAEADAAEADAAAEPQPHAEAPALTPGAPLSTVAPVLAALDEAEADAGAKKPGLFGRMLGRKEKKKVIRRELDDDMLESLEELLISADMGVDTALRVTANLAEGRFGKKLSADEIKQLLADEIARIMEPVAKPMPLYPQKPQVVLVVGVNGSGKTTTIGKLASQFKAAGKKVVIAAGDTFRAAAVEQLQVWGERAGVPVLTAPEGSDPASLAFDAMTKAQEDGADLLMIDTAGRLQNRADLMEELAKIVRVIRKKDETAPHNTILVLDATTGQNALNQVEVFQKLSDVSGLVMTKLDGTAKGGVLVALADKFGLPIHAIGVGEQIDDLAPFDPEEFARALTGAEG